MTLDLAALADRIAIEERLALYPHLLDTQQFERVAEEVFVEDATIDFGAFQVSGRAAIDAQFRGYQAGLKGSSHNLGNLVIALDGDRASALYRVLAFHWFDLPDADPLRATDLLAVGGYADALVRTSLGWRVQHRRGYNFGIGAGSVPAPMTELIAGMMGRSPAWPLDRKS